MFSYHLADLPYNFGATLAPGILASAVIFGFCCYVFIIRCLERSLHLLNKEHWGSRVMDLRITKLNLHSALLFKSQFSYLQNQSFFYQI